MLTASILYKMPPEELSKVKVVTRKNGAKRCHSLGIRNVSLKSWRGNLYLLSWSDENGDPQVIISLDEELTNVQDGNYSHTLTLTS